ncbi:MAG: hypothetical protein JWO02_3560, partial [Solirubrobacterales bacterium]|nr:hypothetical protein [Solirubrobacterales bacterium]
MPLRSLVAAAPSVAWLSVGLGIGVEPLWLAAGVPIIAVVLAARRPLPDDPALEERALRRQLAVIRRRGVPADLLCARAEGVEAEALRASLRISDFAVVTEARSGVHLRALVDTRSLDRPAVERRLCRTLGGEWLFSWARFPDDGATYDALVDHARRRLLRAPLPSSTPTDGTCSCAAPPFWRSRSRSPHPD